MSGGQSCRGWQAGFDLIAPDFRGFGDTQKTAMQTAKDDTPDALASDILALADRLFLERRYRGI